MAPGSKRGANEEGKNRELKLGDLVLAKIKGYPAWPAKISRPEDCENAPEDWKNDPDPKKYLVQFFGTSEIALVGAADVRSFTDEDKTKLSARCQGKTSKYFAQAVKEICDEFEVSKQNNIASVHSTDETDHTSPPHLSSDKMSELPSNPLLKTTVRVEDGSSDIDPKKSNIRQQPKLVLGKKREQVGTKHTKSAPSGHVREFSGDGFPVLGLAAISESDRQKLMKKIARSRGAADAKLNAKGKAEERVETTPTNPQHGHKKQGSEALSPKKTLKRVGSSAKEPGRSHDRDDDFPPPKRCRKEQGRTSTSSLQEAKSKSAHPNKGQSPVNQFLSKRRVVRFYDDDKDDEEIPKTPVRGGVRDKVSVIPRSSDSKMPNVRSERVPNNERVFPKRSPRAIHGKAPRRILKKKPPLEGDKKGSRADSDRSSLFPKKSTSEKMDAPIRDVSDVSMKDLIANASGARKRLELLLNPGGKDFSLSVSNAAISARIRSPTPDPVIESTNALQLNERVVSPSAAHMRQFSPSNQLENVEVNARRVSMGRQGIDADVALNAFERMLENLTRARGSIMRATRQAVDCAKCGIADKIVEILVKKLEDEQDLQRKVDLFFLVDSITLRSHSEKGIAGDCYIPCVQAVLSRIISAVAPPGMDAQENRHLCQKVLRLWLERNIFPEYILRSHMAELEAAIEKILQRHPSPAERSFVDPVMERLIVDEYGSNAAFHFQLPGLWPSRVLIDEEGEDDDGEPEMESPQDAPKQTPPLPYSPHSFSLTPPLPLPLLPPLPYSASLEQQYLYPPPYHLQPPPRPNMMLNSQAPVHPPYREQRPPPFFPGGTQRSFHPEPPPQRPPAAHFPYPIPNPQHPDPRYSSTDIPNDPRRYGARSGCFRPPHERPMMDDAVNFHPFAASRPINGVHMRASRPAMSYAHWRPV